MLWAAASAGSSATVHGRIYAKAAQSIAKTLVAESAIGLNDEPISILIIHIGSSSIRCLEDMQSRRIGGRLPRVVDVDKTTGSWKQDSRRLPSTPRQTPSAPPARRPPPHDAQPPRQLVPRHEDPLGHERVPQFRVLQPLSAAASTRPIPSTSLKHHTMPTLRHCESADDLHGTVKIGYEVHNGDAAASPLWTS